MKILRLLLLLIILCSLASRAAAQYTLGPDSQRQPGVPRGTVTQATWRSKVFPGTVRDYWVYVPAQYQPGHPACVMVFQDGGMFVDEKGSSRIPIVFDNLIHKADMPVTIGIFVNPGVLPAIAANQRARYNRSLEYDGLNDAYSRMLLDEILPEVGRHYDLSANPDARAICGLSSGGICAFTVAWRHPEAFHRVLSFIGSFADLRGGDIYPALIRKTEPKPLRVFMQDGSNDLNIYAGGWYLANQSVATALQYAGYQVKFVAGTMDHDMKQGGAILPDAMRWLWKDYPKPIVAAEQGGKYQFSTEILDPGHAWQPALQGAAAAGSLAAAEDGGVLFAEASRPRIEKISTAGQLSPVTRQGAQALAASGNRWFLCKGARIAALTAGGGEHTVAAGAPCSSLVANSAGGLYFANPARHSIGYISPGGKRSAVYHGALTPSALQLSPDQSLLFVADRSSKWVWSFQVRPDGSLADGEAFYRLETPDSSSASGASAMAVDTLGYLYVATRLGVQVCDQPGRVVAIFANPTGGAMTGLVFSGADHQTLYGIAGGRIFMRHIRRQGAMPWAPVQPPVPHL